MKQSVIGLFGRVINNNELCSDWLFHSTAHHEKETQGGKYIFKYFLSQLFRRVIILYIKRGHQGAVINTRGIETAFERSVDPVIVSLSRDAMHKLCLYYGATVLTTHFTRSDACQWCSGSVNHSPSSSSLLTPFMWQVKSYVLQHQATASKELTMSL